MTKNKISIIIPFSNTESYIKRCLISVRNQTFSRFEVILIDDHSTDGSRLIAEQLVTIDKRFRLVELDGSGPSAARNLGIQEAKNEYIYFLDSDDWLENNCLAELITKIRHEQSQVCLLNFDVINDEQQQVKTKIRTPPLPKYKLTGPDTLKLLLAGRINHYPWSMLIQRSFLINQQIAFPAGRLYEDFATSYKILAAAECISFLDKAMYHYVQHSRSITHTVRLQDAKDILTTVVEMDNYLSDKVDTSLINKYQLPRLFIAYRISCVINNEDYRLTKVIDRVIKDKAKANSMLDNRLRFKILLLKIGLLKLIYKLK